MDYRKRLMIDPPGRPRRTPNARVGLLAVFALPPCHLYALFVHLFKCIICFELFHIFEQLLQKTNMFLGHPINNFLYCSGRRRAPGGGGPY